MARPISEITEAEIEAAADVMLTAVACIETGPKHKWRALKDEDIIAHQEVGDHAARMIHAAEVARESAHKMTAAEFDAIIVRMALAICNVIRADHGLPPLSDMTTVEDAELYYRYARAAYAAQP